MSTYMEKFLSMISVGSDGLVDGPTTEDFAEACGTDVETADIVLEDVYEELVNDETFTYTDDYYMTSVLEDIEEAEIEARSDMDNYRGVVEFEWRTSRGTR